MTKNNTIRNQNLRSFRKQGCIATLLILLITHSPFAVRANSLYFTKEGKPYTEFINKKENYFLLNPQAVSDLFFQIVTLKGNPKVAKHQIQRGLLRCTANSESYSPCFLDQLRLERRTQKFTRKISLPASITKISVTRHSKYRSQVVASWQAAAYTPPLFSVHEFLKLLGAEQDSIYYQLRSDLDSIQLSSSFQSDLSFLAPKNEASNLFKLYERPINDYKDRINFVLDSHEFTESEGILYLQFFWRATSIEINHQIFPVEQVPTLH